MNHLKYRFQIVILLISLIASSSFAATETYTEAIDTAKANSGYTGSTTVADKWLASASSMISINSSDTHGLQYDSTGRLITRTASTYGSFLVSSSIYPHTNYTYRPDKQPYQDSAAWVTTGNDTTRFLQSNSVTSSNVVTLIERGLGMNNDPDPTKAHTVMIEYAVSPDNDHLLRPTKNPDITTYNGLPSDNQYGNSNIKYPFSQPAGMSDQTYSDYQTFYASHVAGSYTGGGQFPYTQLGYTYFWGHGDPNPSTLAQIQGMSEFVILPQTKVNVIGVYSMQSYIYTSNKNDGFSAASDAQYGNGFASFDIDGGNCDTIWAGHRFQVNTRHSTSNPNQITVASGYSVSGGQGILVWSLNYLINNSGTITSDGTTDKFFVGSTSGIGILFEGDTSTTYGTPVTSGINKVINSGIIKGTAAGAGTGIKIVAGDTVIENSGTIAGTTAIQIDSDTTTITNSGAGAITGAVVVSNNSAAALNVGNNALVITGNYTQGSKATLKMTVNSTTDFGTLTATNVSNASSKMAVTVGNYIPNNTVFSNVINGTGVSVPGTVSSSSPVFNFAGSLSGSNVSLTATRANSYQSFASGSNGAAAGSVLNTIAANNTATGDMTTVLNALDSLTSGSQIGQALNSLTPNTDNSAPQTSQASMDQFLSTIFAHLDGFRNVMSSSSDPASSDVITLKDPDIWTSGFGTYLHQDEAASSNGYNATIWGTMLGVEISVIKNLRLGVSGGFAQDFVRTKDSSARTDIDSYQGAIYASYAKDAYFIDNAFSFAYNTYDASRHVAAGFIDRTAAGDYNGQQYSAYIGGGYKFTAKNVELTPLASFQYSHLRLNSYTESGAGALDLKVEAQDYNMAQTGLGMKLGYPLYFKNKFGKLTPETKFKWLYDWVGDAQQSTSGFKAGGGSFNTQGFTPAQSSYDFGAKLTLETLNFVTLSLSYDLELKEGFYGHYGLAEVRYRF